MGCASSEPFVQGGQILENTSEGLTNLVDTANNVGISTVNDISKPLETTSSKIQEAIETAEEVQSSTNEAIDNTTTSATNAVQEIKDDLQEIKEAINEIKNEIHEIPNNVEEAIHNDMQSVEEKIEEKVKGVEDVIEENHEDLVEKIREEVEKFATNFGEEDPEVEIHEKVGVVEEGEEDGVGEEKGEGGNENEVLEEEMEMGWAIEPIAEESEVSDSDESSSSNSSEAISPFQQRLYYMSPPTIKVTPPEGSRTPSPSANEEEEGGDIPKPPKTPKKKPTRGKNKNPQTRNGPNKNSNVKKSNSNSAKTDSTDTDKSDKPKSANAFLQLAAQQRTTRTWQRKVQSRRQAIQNDMMLHEESMKTSMDLIEQGLQKEQTLQVPKTPVDEPPPQKMTEEITDLNGVKVTTELVEPEKKSSLDVGASRWEAAVGVVANIGQSENIITPSNGEGNRLSSLWAELNHRDIPYDQDLRRVSYTSSEEEDDELVPPPRDSDDETETIKLPEVLLTAKKENEEISTEKNGAEDKDMDMEKGNLENANPEGDLAPGNDDKENQVSEIKEKKKTSKSSRKSSKKSRDENSEPDKEILSTEKSQNEATKDSENKRRPSKTSLKEEKEEPRRKLSTDSSKRKSSRQLQRIDSKARKSIAESNGFEEKINV